MSVTTEKIEPAYRQTPWVGFLQSGSASVFLTLSLLVAWIMALPIAQLVYLAVFAGYYGFGFLCTYFFVSRGVAPTFFQQPGTFVQFRYAMTITGLAAAHFLPEFATNFASFMLLAAISVGSFADCKMLYWVRQDEEQSS